MNWSELLQAALLLVVRFVVVWFFGLIQVQIDEASLNVLVGAIVAYLLALFGVSAIRYGLRNTRFEGIFGY